MRESSRSDDGDRICGNCGQALRGDALSCPGCGAELGAECSACRALLPARIRFCGQCGAPRERQPEVVRPTGRRQLTVMFCDLVGYTELSNELDVEQLRDVIAAYQAACTEPVTRFGGTVAQYLGDGLLVYFGYPQAHEDDALRAAHAARAILEALPQALCEALPAGSAVPAVRIGIHTGPVVVDRVGTGERHELLALGDTVNLAARLERAAPAGGALISEATRSLLRDAFELDAPCELALKGFADPILAFRLGSARTLAGRARSRVRDVQALVDREAERQLLLDAFEDAREGRGRAVCVQAEPGLGKSRLVAALRESLARVPHGWRECDGSRFQANTPFHPFVALLREELGLGDAAVADPFLERLTRTLGADVGPEGLTGVATILGADEASIADHGLPSPREQSAEALREHALGAFAQWLAGGELPSASVLVVEDVHWADPSSLELLARLAAAAPRRRLLLLTTARPEFAPPWSEDEATRITLHPLADCEVKQLVRAVATDALDAERVAALVRQSDGVPLFAEELARNALESASEAVPRSLQDSLMARLDRLGPARDVAQTAATIGRDFSLDVLRAVWPGEPARLPELISRLIDADLVVPQPGAAPDDEAFAFRHALFQEVAYESLLRRERRALHGRIARIAEERFPRAAIAAPQSLARHYEAAGQLDEAVAELQRAGVQAAQRSALRESIALLERALRLLADLAPSPERDRRELDLQMALGAPMQATRGYADPEVRRIYKRALALSEASREDHRLGDILWGLFSFNLVRGSLATAGELARALERLAETAGDDGIALAARNAVGSALYFDGHFAEAFDEFERAVAGYDAERHARLAQVRGQDHAVSAQVTAGMAAWMLGRPRTAWNEACAAVERARRLGHPVSLGFALGYAAAVAALCRRTGEVRVLCDELIALAEAQWLPVWGGLGKMLLGWALCGSDEDGRGVENLAQGLAQSAGTGAAFEAPFFSSLVADAHLRGGRREDAVQSVELGTALALRNRSPYADAELARMRGECLLADPSTDRDAPRRAAQQAFEQALGIARAQGAPGPELRARMSAARLWLGTGQVAEARALLEGAEGLWREDDPDNPDLLDLAALRKRLSVDA